MAARIWVGVLVVTVAGTSAAAPPDPDPDPDPVPDAISGPTGMLRWRSEHISPTVPPRVAARNAPDPDDDPMAEEHEDKHYLTALILGGAVIVVPTLYYWDTKSQQSVDWTLKWDTESWKRKIITFDAVRFDTNQFYVNAVHHPLVGIAQYQIGRSNGIGMLGSTVIAAGLGAYWEYFVEFREYPALNDMLMNTIGGLSIGEPLYQIGQVWRGGEMSQDDRLRTAVFSPFDSVHDLIHHQPDWKRPRYASRSIFGIGFATTRLDDTSVRHELVVRADFDVVNHGNFSRSGPRSADIRPGAWSRVAGEVRLGSVRGVLDRAETSFRSQTTIAGHYSQDGEGHGILVALGTGFTYDRTRLAAEYDRLAVGQLAGPQLQISLRRPGLAVRWDAAAYADFGLIQAHVFGPEPPFPKDGYFSPLQLEGYYDAWGASLTSRIRVDSGAWSFDLEAQRHQLYQINGRDRVSRDSLAAHGMTSQQIDQLVPHGTADMRMYWRAAANYHIAGRAWGAALLLDGATRTGSWHGLSRETSTLTVGLAFTLDVDSVRGIRTPL